MYVFVQFVCKPYLFLEKNHLEFIFTLGPYLLFLSWHTFLLRNCTTLKLVCTFRKRVFYHHGLASAIALNSALIFRSYLHYQWPSLLLLSFCKSLQIIEKLFLVDLASPLFEVLLTSQNIECFSSLAMRSYLTFLRGLVDATDFQGLSLRFLME